MGTVVLERDILKKRQMWVWGEVRGSIPLYFWENCWEGLEEIKPVNRNIGLIPSYA